MVLDIYGASDVGCVRELNEDSFCTYGFEDGNMDGFCLISDGMGGHNAGEVASQKTIQFVAEGLIGKMQATDEEITPKELSRIIADANEKIYTMALKNPNQSGMGATLVGLYLGQDKAYVFNVGDSRTYACRGDELRQISRDHSVVEEMVLAGTLTREEARLHPQRNIITRAIGTDPSVETDLFEFDYLPGDCVLLCSDGLSGMIEEDEIRDILKQDVNAEAMVSALIERAKDCGGNDNITAICIRFLQEG